MDICANLKKQVRNAFEEFSSENVNFRIRLKELGLSLDDVMPSIEFSSDGMRIWVENTRIRFDLHGYAHLGYADLSRFVESCWKTPDLIINEFLLAGLLPHPTFFGFGHYSVNLPRQWNEAEGWSNGKITLPKGIRAYKPGPEEDQGIEFVGCAYIARSLFSGGDEEIWIPAGDYEISDLVVEIDHEDDDYEGSWWGHHHAYATGTARAVA